MADSKCHVGGLAKDAPPPLPPPPPRSWGRRRRGRCRELSTVRLSRTGWALAYRGWSHSGHRWSHFAGVRSSDGGYTETCGSKSSIAAAVAWRSSAPGPCSKMLPRGKRLALLCKICLIAAGERSASLLILSTDERMRARAPVTTGHATLVPHWNWQPAMCDNHGIVTAAAVAPPPQRDNSSSSAPPRASAPQNSPGATMPTTGRPAPCGPSHCDAPRDDHAASSPATCARRRGRNTAKGCTRYGPRYEARCARARYARLIRRRQPPARRPLD